MATYYLDFEGGSDAADGTSYANRWLTVTNGATAARIAPGDTIRVMASKDATSLSQSASWTNGGITVTLTSAVTANIDTCESAWTNAMGGNGSTSTTTTNKEGTNGCTVAPGAGFTTGMMAYKALGGATDFSGYKQVSLWFKSTVALAASDVSLRLCSDAAGVTTVDTINIPAVPAANIFQAITVDTGGALGNSIQSIAIDANVDKGALTIAMDNIIACKDSTSADALTLNSLIGKNADDGLWWPIKNINGTTIEIDALISSENGAGRGYVGTTESVTTYKREPILLTAVASGTAIGTISDSGSVAGGQITFSGGWNRTDMSTQTGETWCSGQNGAGYFITASSKNYLSFEKLSGVRFQASLRNTGTNNTRWIMSNCHATACGIGFDITSAWSSSFSNCHGYSNNTNYSLTNTSGSFSSCKIYSTATASGFIISGNGKVVFDNCSFTNNTAYGLGISGASDSVYFYNCTFASHGTASISMGSNPVQLFLRNCTLSDATEVAQFANYQTGTVYSEKHDGTTGNHYIVTDGGSIITDTTTRHVAVGASWKFTPTSTNRDATYPLALKIATILCAANKQVTVKAWLRRSNTGLTGMLVCRGGQIAGVSNDVTDTMTASADTWDQRTISFTPTEAGPVEIECWFYGGTTYTGYVHDLTIFQG